MKFENMELVVSGNLELTSNLASLETLLDKSLEKYHALVVTPDSLKDAKQDMAEINKGKKAVEDAWKAKKKEIQAPLAEFEAGLKSLLGKCDLAREAIKSQVDSFEAGRREEAQRACDAYRDALCAEKGIDPLTLPLVGFDNLTYITDSGKLASVAKAKIDNMVMLEVNRLAEIKLRELEAEQEKQRLINEAKEQARQEMERELELKAQMEAFKKLEEQAEVVSMPNPSPTELEAMQEREEPKEAPKASEGNVVYRIDALFNIQAKAGNEAKIKAFVEEQIKLLEKLAPALIDVEVVTL